ncbi:SMR family transporter (plasmid) [Curtobacterium sp. C1]|uniref:DMT family transporter n=1 Tax=Curtobacterium sp. C1 TaxID=2898151 RepID=UPI001E2EC49C|nr:SMR family transporter [Curtobacterium sp. C1]UFU15903.1 SMR family transporter [Curtobacterium sp. C1]UFU16010.1 SMR family transporter [Curtobacterium sp. C1]
MQWLFLIGAITLEVAATLSLRVASGGKKLWYVGVAVGYIASFIMLTLTLNAGLGLGVAYGIWAASGVAITAVASKFLFKEPFTVVMAAGIVLIIGGVLFVEIGAGH